MDTPITPETEQLYLRIYASGFVAGAVTHQVNAARGDELPPNLDQIFATAVTRARRLMDDPAVRQQIIDMIADDTPGDAAVMMRVGGGQ